MRAMLTVVAAGLLVAADAPKDDPNKEDLAKIQGEWIIVAHEAMGKKSTEEEIKNLDGKLVIEGNGYDVTFGGAKVAKGKLKLDASKKPKHVDALDDSFGGKAMPGIYELDGDTMKVCFSEPGGKRPTEFKTKEGEPGTFITYKRAKK